ncbi:MAG: OmpA family protein [Elusimicrobiaceae bacterium]|uniref:OmpA family protein n=1 Tax=Candidatus Avelusimicrobium gallicola TaxID=2562704 RepID=A0A928HGF3_9BACT|nr:OmpA family protein [Elusimicrobium sp.]MBQ9970879.1 OmpA family protein [Elusimicrobiaceae bacterium]
MKLKTFCLFVCSVALFACSSAQKEEDIPTPTKRDPIIEEQAKKNERLYNQSEARMAKTLELPAITYEFDSVRPPDYAYPFLDKVANVMNEHPSLHLIVEGHTDVLGTEEYNYWLGASRAAAMKSYLVSRGVNAERIRIHSHGKDRPLTLDNSSEGRRTNRRVEFTFTKRSWNAIY